MARKIGIGTSLRVGLREALRHPAKLHLVSAPQNIRKTIHMGSPVFVDPEAETETLIKTAYYQLKDELEYAYESCINSGYNLVRLEMRKRLAIHVIKWWEDEEIRMKLHSSIVLRDEAGLLRIAYLMAYLGVDPLLLEDSKSYKPDKNTRLISAGDLLQYVKYDCLMEVDQHHQRLRAIFLEILKNRRAVSLSLKPSCNLLRIDLWCPPPQNCIKVNCDGAAKERQTFIGDGAAKEVQTFIGFLGRDESGTALFSAYGRVEGSTSDDSEIMAVIAAMEYTLNYVEINFRQKHLDDPQIIIEVDSENIYKVLELINIIRSRLNMEVWDLMLKFKYLEISWVRRECNKAANQLTKIAKLVQKDIEISDDDVGNLRTKIPDEQVQTFERALKEDREGRGNLTARYEGGNMAD